MSLYIILAVCIIAAIGIIVGFCFGYIRLSSWGGTVAGATLVCFVVDRAGFIPEGDWHGMIILGVAACALLILTLLFALVRRFLKKRTAVGAKLSFYRQYDDMEDNDMRILLSLDKGDKKAYRKYSRVRFRRRRGAWGVVDRVFGAITLTLNIFAAIVIIGALALLVIDAAGITAAKDALDEYIYSNAFWQGEGSALAIDLLVVTLMCMCIRLGYHGGILSALSALLVLGVLAGAGYLAYYMAFQTDLFGSVSSGVYDNLLAGALSGMQSSLDAAGLTAEVIGNAVVAAGLFVILLIPAIIICVFIPRSVEKLRSFETVAAIDGAFGAVVVTAIVFAALIFLGAVVWQISDLEGLAVFNSYMERTHVADALYGDNYVGSLGFIVDLPLRAWVGLD